MSGPIEMGASQEALSSKEAGITAARLFESLKVGIRKQPDFKEGLADTHFDFPPPKMAEFTAGDYDYGVRHVFSGLEEGAYRTACVLEKYDPNRLPAAPPLAQVTLSFDTDSSENLGTGEFSLSTPAYQGRNTRETLRRISENFSDLLVPPSNTQ